MLRTSPKLFATSSKIIMKTPPSTGPHVDFNPPTITMARMNIIVDNSSRLGRQSENVPHEHRRYAREECSDNLKAMIRNFVRLIPRLAA